MPDEERPTQNIQNDKQAAPQEPKQKQQETKENAQETANPAEFGENEFKQPDNRKDKEKTKSAQIPKDNLNEEKKPGLFRRVLEVIKKPFKAIKKAFDTIRGYASYIVTDPQVKRMQVEAAKAAGEEVAKREINKAQKENEAKKPEKNSLEWSYKDEPAQLKEKKDKILNDENMKDDAKIRALAKLCHKEYENQPLIFAGKDGTYYMMRNENKDVVISAAEKRVQAVPKVGLNGKAVEGEYSINSEYVFKERGHAEFNRLNMVRVKESDLYNVNDDIEKAGGVGGSNLTPQEGIRMREQLLTKAVPGVENTNNAELLLDKAVTAENLFYHPDEVLNALNAGTAVMSADMVKSFAESKDPDIRLMAVNAVDENVHGPAVTDQVLSSLIKDKEPEVSGPAKEHYNKMIAKELESKTEPSPMQRDYLIGRQAPKELQMIAVQNNYGLDFFTTSKNWEVRAEVAKQGYRSDILSLDKDERVKAAVEEGYDHILKQLEDKKPFRYFGDSLKTAAELVQNGDTAKEEYLVNVANAVTNLDPNQASFYADILAQANSDKVNEALGEYGPVLQNPEMIEENIVQDSKEHPEPILDNETIAQEEPSVFDNQYADAENPFHLDENVTDQELGPQIQDLPDIPVDQSAYIDESVSQIDIETAINEAYGDPELLPSETDIIAENAPMESYLKPPEDVISAENSNLGNEDLTRQEAVFAQLEAAMNAGAISDEEPDYSNYDFDDEYADEDIFSASNDYEPEAEELDSVQRELARVMQKAQHQQDLGGGRSSRQFDRNSGAERD